MLKMQVYNIIKKSVYHSIQFISVIVKKNLRKSQAEFREKLRKLRLKQNNGFLIKNHVSLGFSIFKVLPGATSKNLGGHIEELGGQCI